MFDKNFNNRFAKAKIVGVNTASAGDLSGGLTALNFILAENLSGVNCLAVDRHDTQNLDGCNAAHKFRLLDTDDEQTLVKALRGADLLFVVADLVWENIKAVALAAHCAKKIGAPVIFIAGGDFEFAEDEIIFDALIKLPSKNFGADACKVVKNFVEVLTLQGQPKIDLKDIAAVVKDSAAIVSYGERDGKNAVVKAAKAALEHAEASDENFKAAEKILCNVTAAKGNPSLEEAEKLSRLFKRHAPKAEILFGFSVDDWLADKVKILLMASRKFD